MSTAKTSWTAELDRKLLLAIIKDADVKVNTVNVAAMMSTDDLSLTAIAVKRRFERLRDMARNMDAAGVPDTTDAPAEPSAPKGKAKKTAKRVADAAVADAGDDEKQPSPEKKARKASAAPKKGKGKQAGAKDTEEAAEIVKSEQE